MEKSRRVTSYHNQYRPVPSRMNQPRKSLSTSNLFSKTKPETFSILKPQYSEPAYKEGSQTHFLSYELHSSYPRISFEETDSQASVPSLPRSPIRIRIEESEILPTNTKSDLQICDSESDGGSFSFTDLGSVQERDEICDDIAE